MAGAALHVAYVNEQDPATFAWIEPNGGLDYQGPASGGDDSWLDQLKTMSDTAGLIDPTIFSDGVSALISLYQGNYGEAVLSVLAMPPVLGVIARGGKYTGRALRYSDEAQYAMIGVGANRASGAAREAAELVELQAKYPSASVLRG